MTLSLPIVQFERKPRQEQQRTATIYIAMDLIYSNIPVRTPNKTKGNRSELLPPKHVLVVKELLFFFDDSSMACCLGGSGASREKLFMRMLSFLRRRCGGLCGAATQEQPARYVVNIARVRSVGVPSVLVNV